MEVLKIHLEQIGNVWKTCPQETETESSKYFTQDLTWEMRLTLQLIHILFTAYSPEMVSVEGWV